MSGVPMHENELHSDEALVRGLLAEQCPQWAHLPVRRFPSGGTANAIYRVGDEIAARLPLTPGGSANPAKSEQFEKGLHWVPIFAPHLPLAVPELLARGEPTAAFPSEWTVCRWLPGEIARFEDLADPVAAAHALGAFVQALQALDASEGPPPGRHNFERGVPLAARDQRTRESIAASRNLVDIDVVGRAWERDLAAPVWDRAPVWIHGDLLPGNLLTLDGRLSAVIDWGGLGVGDPAIELLPAWTLFRGESRAAYREATGADDAMWARGRGLALSAAIIGLPYYIDSNPTMVATARHILGEVLEDHGAGAEGA